MLYSKSCTIFVNIETENYSLTTFLITKTTVLNQDAETMGRKDKLYMGTYFSCIINQM